MAKFDKRLADLEANIATPPRAVHLIVQKPGQNKDQVLDAYGPARIGPNDLVIVQRIVHPL